MKDEIKNEIATAEPTVPALSAEDAAIPEEILAAVPSAALPQKAPERSVNFRGAHRKIQHYLREFWRKHAGFRVAKWFFVIAQAVGFVILDGDGLRDHSGFFGDIGKKGELEAACREIFVPRGDMRNVREIFVYEADTFSFFAEIFFEAEEGIAEEIF